MLTTRLSTTVFVREEVNAKQKRIFDPNYGNYSVGCRAQSNPILVHWFGQSTNHLR